jgi:peptidyl-prolyl cis-trans isomerase SurA
MKLRTWWALLLLLPLAVSAQEVKKRVVEEIVARVNNEIITLTDFQRAHGSVRREAEEECEGCSREKLEAFVVEKEKNLLRDMIDNMLLVQRAKDLGYNVETEVVRRMDAIRQQNNIEDLDALCRAVESTGVSCEDWKNTMRNGLLAQEVIRRDVGRTLSFSKEEVQKYYDEHKTEFVKPEQVYLAEMFVSTEGKPEAEIPALEKKAQDLRGRVVKGGEDFNELAKRYSEGSTAQQGGALGYFERGQLAPELETIAFQMNRGDVSEVIRTKTGFLILKCEIRYEAGQQPLEKVETEIMNRLYAEKMQPGLRVYLTKLREESFIQVKAGYVDTAAVASVPILETQPVPEEEKGKKKKKEKGEKSGE